MEVARKRIEEISKLIEQGKGTSADLLEQGLLLQSLGCTHEAREAFSRGLVLDPFHIELRQQRARKNMVDNHWQAISDFTLVSILSPDYWEVWYYMGVAYSFIREYEKAYDSLTTCLEKATRAGASLVPVVDWLWTLGKRLGLPDVDSCLDLIGPDAELSEDDYSYFRRLMLYKGLLAPEGFFDWGELERRGNSDVDFVTQAYGLATWHYFRGEAEESNRLLLQIRERDSFPTAFAYFHAMQDIEERGL